jgi:hypothetical protein
VTPPVVKHSEPQHTVADQDQRFRVGSWRNGGLSGFVHVVTGVGQGYDTVSTWKNVPSP